MVQKTRHATTNFKMLLPFVDAVDRNDGYYKATSEGFMDLSLDNLCYKDCYGNPVYSISHYGKQNGDLMADPDMTFSINRETGVVIPMTFQNDYLGIYQQVFQERGGRLMYSSHLLVDLDEFLWQWLKNIQVQGFKAE